MTFDEVHARYAPFLAEAGFTLVKEWRGMGRVADYESETLDLRLALDKGGTMDISLSPHLCKDHYRWTGCGSVRAWVLDQPVWPGPVEESPERSVRETIEDFEFLKEQLPKVRELFSPACYSGFQQSLKKGILEAWGEWGGGMRGNVLELPYIGQKGQDPRVPSPPVPKKPAVPRRGRGLRGLMGLLARSLSRFS